MNPGMNLDLLHDLIREFVALHPELADQREAYAMCDDMTDKFIRFAGWKGYPGLTRYTFECHPYGLRRSNDKPNPAPEIYQPCDSEGRARANESGWSMCTWHCVVDAGTILIDFTARQYSKDLAYPLIIPIGDRAFAAKVGV